MSGWPRVPLSEVMHLALDPHPVEPETKYPNLGIYSFARGAFGKAPIDGAKTSARTLYRVRKHQFIYSRLFAFEGAYTVVPEAMDGFFVSNEYPTFECDPERVDHQYLRWLFSCPDVWRDIAAESKGMGDRRRRVHPEQVLAYRMPLPPIDEQRRIVARLDKVAALVEERRQAIEVAEREAQALLLKAFERAIEGAPYRPMAEIAPLVRRPVEIEPDQSYPELGIRSFGRGTFHKAALTGMEVGTKKLFHICEGDLLFNIVFAWEGAVAVAQPEDNGRFGSHRFLTCVPDPSVATPEFLRFYFLTSEGLKKLGEASPGGAGRNRTLGLKKLETIEVPVPPVERQRWFNRIQKQVHQVYATRERTAEEVDALMPALLYEVFNDGTIARRPGATRVASASHERASTGEIDVQRDGHSQRQCLGGGRLRLG